MGRGEREEVLLLGRRWKSGKTLLLVFVQSRHLEFWCKGIEVVISWKWNKLPRAGMLLLTLRARSQLCFASGECEFAFALQVSL